MPQHRTVFFVSDGTGITAQMLGNSLLTQFEGVEFNQVTLPFIDSVDKARVCLQRIERESLRGDGRPVVFSTLVNGDVARWCGGPTRCSWISSRPSSARSKAAWRQVEPHHRPLAQFHRQAGIQAAHRGD